MKFCHYQECLSPHMMPLMRAMVARLGEDEVCYVYTQDLEAERQALGWADAAKPRWALDARQQPEEACKWLERCPCLMSGCRDFDLFERRAGRRLATFYSGERWFKPLSVFRGRISLPGWLRLLSPRYFHMAYRMRRLLCGKNSFYYLPDGIWAARDMIRIMNFLKGNFLPLDVMVLRIPGSVLQNHGKVIDKIRLWGYFAEPSSVEKTCVQSKAGTEPLKVLWVGRLLELKRVDVLLRAIRAHHLKKIGTPDMILNVYGDGPAGMALKKMATGCGEVVRFHHSVVMGEVRNLMQEHDVYVFTSNAYEGWGMVVSEALEAGMHVLGTYEAGSSATMLNDDDLFHAGDWKRLQFLLERCLDEKRQGTLKGQGIGEWSAEKAADRLMALMDEVRNCKL